MRRSRPSNAPRVSRLSVRLVHVSADARSLPVALRPNSKPAPPALSRIFRRNAIVLKPIMRPKYVSAERMIPPSKTIAAPGTAIQTVCSSAASPRSALGEKIGTWSRPYWNSDLHPTAHDFFGVAHEASCCSSSSTAVHRDQIGQIGCPPPGPRQRLAYRVARRSTALSCPAPPCFNLHPNTPHRTPCKRGKSMHHEHRGRPSLTRCISRMKRQRLNLAEAAQHCRGSVPLFSFFEDTFQVAS